MKGGTTVAVRGVATGTRTDGPSTAGTGTGRAGCARPWRPRAAGARTREGVRRRAAGPSTGRSPLRARQAAERSGEKGGRCRATRMRTVTGRGAPRART
eukprot:5255882-Pleurochrysis_carterae.AAC.1